MARTDDSGDPRLARPQRHAMSSLPAPGASPPGGPAAASPGGPPAGASPGGPPAGASPGGPPAGAPPPRRDASRRRRPVGTLLLLAVGGPAAIALLATVLLLLSPPAQQATRAVQDLIEAPAASGTVRGVTDAEVVVGMVSPFSGANRELGHAVKAGVDAAFAEVNARGGVHGRRLRLVTFDDGFDPARTGPAMRQLVEVEKVFAVVGSVGTPTAAVSIPYCAANEVVFFGALTGGEVLRKDPPDRHVFNFRPSYAEETAAAVRYLVEVRRVAPSRVAVLAQDDAFGEWGWRGAARQLEAYGVEAGRVLRVAYRRNTAEVTDAIAALRERAGEVDAVVMVATYRAATTFIRRARDAGLQFVATNVSAVDASALAEELVSAGGRYTHDVVVTHVVPLPTSRAPAATRFREALARHAADARPDVAALEGFVVGSLFAEGLRRAGRDLDTASLVAALESIRDLDLGLGAPLSFGAREHQASHKVWGSALQPDGSYRPVEMD